MTGQTESLGRLRLVETRALEGLLDHRAFHVLEITRGDGRDRPGQCDTRHLRCRERFGKRRRCGRRLSQGQVLRRNEPSVTEDRGALQDISQLAHVSRPRIPDQQLAGVA